MIPTFNYTIEPNNFCVNIYVDTQIEPLIHQPLHPDGVAWTSEDDARTWAENYIAKQIEYYNLPDDRVIERENQESDPG